MNKVVRTVLKYSPPALLMFGLAATSYAQSTINTSDVNGLAEAVFNFLAIVGALIIAGALIFVVVKFLGHNYMEGVAGIAGIIAGGYIIYHAKAWSLSLTGTAF